MSTCTLLIFLFGASLLGSSCDSDPGMEEEKERNDHPDSIEEHEIAPEVERIGGIEARATCNPLWTECHPS